MSEVSKSFGAHSVLRNVSFALPFGSVGVILGPNGAGKSTLLNLIAGFLRPDGGRITLGDHDLTTKSPETIARMGTRLVFQSTRLWESMSVYENLVCASEAAQQQGTAMVDRTLELSGLLPHSNRRPSEISAGQRKILAIALALVAEPRLLLLDEPSATLDSRHSARVFEYISNVDRSDKILLIVEHNLHLLDNFVTDALFLHNGEIRASGPYAEIVARPDLRKLYLGLAV